MDILAADNIMDFTVVTYHAWWPSSGDPFYQFNITENTDRISWYSVSGTPTMKFDGIITGASIGSWQGQVDARAAIAAPVSIVPAVTYNPGTQQCTVNATITNESATTITGTYKLAVTASEIHWTAPNGLQVHNFTMRDMVPNHAGTAVNLGPGASTVIPLTFTISLVAAGVTPAPLLEDIQIVCFVQKNSPKEIVQAARIFFPVTDPYLAVGSQVSVPAPGGDGDAWLDAGESGELTVTVANLNPAAATGATGTLTTSDPYITIVDGSTTFGTIPGLGTGTHAGDPFRFSVSPSAPSGYAAQFTLTVNAGAIDYTRQLAVSAEVGSPTDHIGPIFGYYAYENSDVGYTETPTYAWVEIDSSLGGPGTKILNLDDGAASYRLPFTFRFEGANYDTVTVSSNGWVAMGRQLFSDGDNSPSDIPDADGPFAMIAGMWDDLDPTAAGGGKIWRYNDLANHRFIVEWSGVEHFLTGGGGLPEWFQIILLDPAFYPTGSGNGEILVAYKDVNDPGSVVAGLENRLETAGIQYSFFGDANPAAVGIADQRIIKYTTDAAVRTTVATTPAGAGPVLLLAASPNPFASATELSFRLPERLHATLRVYGADGRLVTTLFNGIAEAGITSARWNGLDSSGRAAAAGLYFARLETGGTTQFGKVLLLK